MTTRVAPKPLERAKRGIANLARPGGVAQERTTDRDEIELAALHALNQAIKVDKLSAQSSHRMGGLIRPHESEERFEVLPSVANQAAAFARISRSSLN